MLGNAFVSGIKSVAGTLPESYRRELNNETNSQKGGLEMRAEILKAVEAASEYERLSKALVVGSSKSRAPRDIDGNVVGAPIMAFFDASKGSVFFRTQDENGDPWGFDFPLAVAEALSFALADLLGTFETLPADRIEALKAELKAEKTASSYWAGETASSSNERDRFKAEKKILLDKIEEKDRRLAELEHFVLSVYGLWATDRPDLVFDPKRILFEIKPPESPKAEEVAQ